MSFLLRLMYYFSNVAHVALCFDTNIIQKKSIERRVITWHMRQLEQAASQPPTFIRAAQRPERRPSTSWRTQRSPPRHPKGQSRTRHQECGCHLITSECKSLWGEPERVHWIYISSEYRGVYSLGAWIILDKPWWLCTYRGKSVKKWNENVPRMCLILFRL